MIIRKALVVDDDEDILRLCEVSLRAFAGWTVALARSADAALVAAVAEAPDVILLDLMMPGGDGFGALTQLKACAETARIPVVLLSAADDASVTSCVERGFAGHIPKPFEPSSLPDEILRIVGMERT